ncbi:serine/threonine-protein kinase DCLK3 [Hyla sarda]|uniref:serine/threonine-protein kinase DCLK3 n=1 Tax=Hyla sarda TaxID=327740 RepID=UPI0024C3C35F|nr:serine/threonine-protein kinase DCLK3 [Hyla sarda]
MPGGAFLRTELASCTCKHHGQQRLYGHLYNNLHVRSTDRRHQVTCPPIGPRAFGKPFQGMNTYSSPYFHSQNGFHTIHSENSPVKPKIVTVVKPGSHPLKKITLLLNRRSVQTFEQLIADISEGLGLPRWKNDRVRKLYNLKGKEIHSVSDFFRGDDVFIALGREQLTLKSIEIVLNELYPDRSFKQNKDYYEKLRCKFSDNGLNIDSGYEDTDTTHKLENIMSSTVVNKTNSKTHGKSRTEESRRQKKHDKFKSDQEHLPRVMKKLEICHSKPLTLLATSLDYTTHCEHCTTYKIKKKLNSDFGNDTLEDLSLTEICRKQRPEKPKPTCIVCHSRTRVLGMDYGEVGERVDSDMDLNQNSNWPPHRIQRQTNDIETKSKCHKEIKKCNGEHPDCSPIKPSRRRIEDFLEDTKENVLINTDKTITDNESNSKKEMANIAHTTQKVSGGKSSTCEEKGILPLSQRSIRDKMDIDKYYEIGKSIGDGNFAVVKECRIRNTNQEFAMKIIDKAKLVGKEDIIENEVRIIKLLSHPNIVKLLDNFETENEIYLIMEYIKGGDLFDAITESIKFTEHNAALMLNDLCEALGYIHGKNIVHRDLKPENLLVQKNPDGSSTLKLADFGLAVFVTEPILTVCGTPTYVAPEILSEKGYGLEVDMWATGIILYILLCGFPPFRSPERNQEELFEIIQRGEYEFLSPYWDNISEEAKDLVSRLLVLSPLKRFTAKCVLQHSWVKSRGQMNVRNLQREITMNIERHFRNRRQKKGTQSDL